MIKFDKKIRLDCYIDVLDRFKYKYNDAIFEIITRVNNSPLSPSWDLLKRYKDKKIDFKMFLKMLEQELLNRTEAIKRMDELLELLARGKTIFLVCYEHDWKKCHRKLVKQLLKNRLIVKKGFSTIFGD